MLKRQVRALAAFLVLSGTFVACAGAGISTGEGQQAGATGQDAGADSGIRGLGCGLEKETNTVLCSAISSCPGLVVNQDAYPGCGFRVSGGTFDLQCACGADLCPIGTPRTCTQARTLLADQNRLLVCAQASEGRCIGSTKAKPGASGTPNNRGCDPLCMTDCARAGSGNCAFLCGC